MSNTIKAPSPRLLSHLFTSLSTTPRPWHLRRILRSDNPAEINGELTGSATFHALPSPSSPSSSPTDRSCEMVYREEGEMPSGIMGMAGMKWSKKYIWRMNNIPNNRDQEEEGGPDAQGISVWFVKIQPGPDEADYLFHEFDFGSRTLTTGQEQEKGEGEDTIEPPTPPLVGESATTVIKARGNHLCIKDMYRTAYSFRVVPETGQVLSWASRHVVKGPKKNQDIVNLYFLD
ncbi:hypothetical protein BGW36DRAFT_369326 [Talaromyces proteolyticus]|uniref:DUF6314 domain-containing protein n=1 Tax=Talaromyces proteolyticus TaxID=1131652 RepID=A0AAD4Q4N0_9EURO|nr:uncharacterized protein BGW36DRAFT_369326 [Talaromyces proteolyticus]KAH8703431.1 hypothetical protein BGW36DRAFT_369326 [Talaromyces proteolyticus]